LILITNINSIIQYKSQQIVHDEILFYKTLCQ
jgi:hypothetical protein